MLSIAFPRPVQIRRNYLRWKGRFAAKVWRGQSGRRFENQPWIDGDIPSGHFVSSIGKKDWEGKGVVPDVIVSPDKAQPVV